MNNINIKLRQPFFSFGVENYAEQYVCSPFVELFYKFSTQKTIDRSNRDYFMVCIPDGCVDVLFIRQNDRYRIELIGTPVCHKHLIVYPEAEYFGMRLQPGISLPDFDVSISEITDTETFVPQFSSTYYCLTEKIFASESFEERIALFMAHFNKYPSSAFMVNDAVQQIIRMIQESHGSMDISEIAESICYSERHTNRIFSGIMGYSPKLFSRIVRFQYAVENIMKSNDEPVSDLISSLSYSDQSHFQRECKEFTGLTPKQFSHFCSEYIKKRG